MATVAAEITIGRQTWPEAEIVARPVKAKALSEPRVLVRRKKPLILGPDGQEMIYLEGPAAISLFTGAGGMDLGMEMAGFVTLVQHEMQPDACETLMVNRPRAFRHAALIQGDINRTPTSMLLKEASLRVGEAHIVTGGPPCQGFSTSGKRRMGDERNDLVFQFLRVVREAKPKFFLMENVPGFTNFNKGSYLEAFLKEAYECYYELVYGIANAVEYGVPQNRNRFLCMGTRRDLVECDGVLGSLPAPQNFGQRDLDYLASVQRETLFRDFGDQRAELLTHAPGIRYFPDRPVLTPPAPSVGAGSDGRTETFIKFYRKLLAEEPDRIVTHPRDQRD